MFDVLRFVRQQSERLALGFCLLMAVARVEAINPLEPQHDCGFDIGTMSFAGDDTVQAICLLRPLEPYGRSGPPLQELPSFLASHLGTTFTSNPTRLSALRSALSDWLLRNKISTAEIGGAMSEPLSSTEEAFGPPLPARYFVLHDTSHPNLLDAAVFPQDLNLQSWEHNQLERWLQGETSKAHLFISRDGRSVTAIPFSRGWRATKLEVQVVGEASRGRFLHIEHVQPRRSARDGPAGNDAIAPVPGFTKTQLNRSALLYLITSVRSGSWLIPAFHHNIDAAIPLAHDDPQNFDLEQWDALVETLWNEITAAD